MACSFAAVREISTAWNQQQFMVLLQVVFILYRIYGKLYTLKIYLRTILVRNRKFLSYLPVIHRGS